MALTVMSESPVSKVTIILPDQALDWLQKSSLSEEEIRSKLAAISSLIEFCINEICFADEQALEVTEHLIKRLREVYLDLIGIRKNITA